MRFAQWAVLRQSRGQGGRSGLLISDLFPKGPRVGVPSYPQTHADRDENEREDDKGGGPDLVESADHDGRGQDHELSGAAHEVVAPTRGV